MGWLSRVIVFCQRQSDGERAAHAQSAGHTDLSPEIERKMLDDGKPQARSTQLLRTRLVDPEKSFEQAILVFRRNADPGVDYIDHNHFVFPSPSYGDRSALGRVLHRIVDQVVQDMPQGFCIGLHKKIFVRRIVGEGDLL